MSPTEMFEEFDKEPIAAASLAQVHKAVTKDKKKVAVKVSIKSVTDKKKMGTIQSQDHSSLANFKCVNNFVGIV